MQPARCSRPDTGHQHVAAGVVLVSRPLNHRSDERVSPETGYQCAAAKKLILFTGLRVSLEIPHGVHKHFQEYGARLLYDTASL